VTVGGKHTATKPGAIVLVRSIFVYTTVLATWAAFIKENRKTII